MDEKDPLFPLYVIITSLIVAGIIGTMVYLMMLPTGYTGPITVR